MTYPLVSFKNVSKNFGKMNAVTNLNFEIDKGEFLAIMGPSGCGSWGLNWPGTVRCLRLSEAPGPLCCKPLSYLGPSLNSWGLCRSVPAEAIGEQKCRGYLPDWRHWNPKESKNT